MAIPTNITTGEQVVTATGAVTGSLATATLTNGIGAIKVRVTGLLSGQSVRIAVEDTVNATPFADALQVFVFDTTQGAAPDGNTFSVQLINLPDARFGVALSKLRLNVQAITASTSIKVLGWLEQ
jgi:hypothetical protein